MKSEIFCNNYILPALLVKLPGSSEKLFWGTIAVLTLDK